MFHQRINRCTNQQMNIPFRAKSAGVSLLAIMIIGIFTVANGLTLLTDNDSIPDGALSLATLHIVLFIGAGQMEDRTEQDNNVNALSSRNAYSVLIAGVMFTIASLFMGFTPFKMASVLLVAFWLAEIIRFASQLVYYRQSA